MSLQDSLILSFLAVIAVIEFTAFIRKTAEREIWKSLGSLGVVILSWVIARRITGGTPKAWQTVFLAMSAVALFTAIIHKKMKK